MLQLGNGLCRWVQYLVDLTVGDFALPERGAGTVATSCKVNKVPVWTILIPTSHGPNAPHCPCIPACCILSLVCENYSYWVTKIRGRLWMGHVGVGRDTVQLLVEGSEVCCYRGHSPYIYAILIEILGALKGTWPLTTSEVKLLCLPGLGQVND